MQNLTRRSFLEKVSLITGAVLAHHLPVSAGVRQAEPHMSFPSTPRDRVAIASYPFRAYIESPTNRNRNPSLPGMDLTQFASEVVKKFNIHNIEPHSRHFRSLDSAYLGTFREELLKANAKVVNIAVSTEESFYDADAGARKKAVAFAKKWLDVAVAIGSPSIRAHIRAASNSAPNVQRTVECLREVSEYGGEKKVVVNLENDDLVSEDAFFLVKVIEDVKHAYLRALPDFANSALTGEPEVNYRALQAMFEQAYCICHVKDGETDDHGKRFSVDLKRSFDILKSSGYRGYCSMEFDEPGDPYAPTAKLVEQTIRLLS
jgi:sugar phosphate isomerase/epimerase